MFLGHYGIGLGAKGAAPRVSLGTLFLAAQFLDLLWPTLILVHLETVKIKPGATKLTPLNFVSYPISHSLLMALVWGLLIGGVYWLQKRNTRGALVVGICVVSHWLLDMVVHRPDLPLFPGGSFRAGLGLWNMPARAIFVEGLVFLFGLTIYGRITKAKNTSGRIGFGALVLILSLIYIANIAGPPPPSTGAIAWAGQLQWIFVAWAYWIDRNRTAKVPA